MRWPLVLRRWIGLTVSLFLLIAAITGGLLLFVDSASIEQIHVRLFAGAAGEWIVNVATAAVSLIVPTGLLLWWRRPRFAIHTSKSLFRTLYDLHNVLGFYASLLLLLLAGTGAFLGFQRPLGVLLGVQEWRIPDPPRSTPRAGAPIPRATFMTAAQNAVPGAAVTRLTGPRRRTSAVRIEMRGPGPFDQATVYLDRYTGAVLRIDDLASTPLWYRKRVIALALHTGNVYGVAGKVAALVTSAVLTFLALTGVWMWWSPLRRRRTRRATRITTLVEPSGESVRR
ncbi:MAG TPA: PepSY-associated TM helix domain-containing protein [Thermoanaerobaculia bacterium]|nr:PepSY-associated TM helix domain-containing protein [Thermoanaerobaculia bacterium]